MITIFGQSQENLSRAQPHSGIIEQNRYSTLVNRQRAQISFIFRRSPKILLVTQYRSSGKKNQYTSF